jgi:hypothetical protein
MADLTDREILDTEENVRVIFQEIHSICTRQEELTDDCRKLTNDFDNELRAIKLAYVSNIQDVIIKYNDRLLKLYNRL